MLTKSKIRFIKSLQEKKYRKQEQCFVVEGAKSVAEVLLSDFEIVTLVGTESYFNQLKSDVSTIELVKAKESELAPLGDFQSNDAVLAVVRIKETGQVNLDPNSYTLFLDDIRDPGNLGTIIRTADWFGFKNIVASENTVDFYNPKVINSTKGSFLRVQYVCEDLKVLLSQNNVIPVYGAFLDGENVHQTGFGKSGILIIGNESKGISEGIAKFVTHRITIPRFGEAESLNAAIATAIIMDNIRR